MDVVEELRAIRSELLRCANTLRAAAIDVTNGKLADIPERLARRAAHLEITDGMLCEVIAELGGKTTY